jgi:hypothetical protein
MRVLILHTSVILKYFYIQIKNPYQKLYILANDDTVEYDPLFNHSSATKYCGDPGVSIYLLHISEALGLNLGLKAGYYNQGFSWYPSFPPNKCLNTFLKQDTTLPHTS